MENRVYNTTPPFHVVKKIKTPPHSIERKAQAHSCSSVKAQTRNPSSLCLTSPALQLLKKPWHWPPPSPEPPRASYAAASRRLPPIRRYPAAAAYSAASPPTTSPQLRGGKEEAEAEILRDVKPVVNSSRKSSTLTGQLSVPLLVVVIRKSEAPRMADRHTFFFQSPCIFNAHNIHNAAEECELL
jgi:hypothetical protein